MGRPGASIFRLASAFYLLLAVAAVVWLGWRQGTIASGLFWAPGALVPHLAAGLGAGAALALAWELARRGLASARRLEERLEELLGDLDTGEALALAALSGFSEEIFFRGAVLTEWGWLPATALFALLHTGPGPGFRLWTLFAALAGLVLAGLTLWSGTLLPAVTAHAAVNALGLVRLVRRRRGRR